MRLLYFILISLSLVSAWFGMHELSEVPLGNVQGLALVGMGMLILAWVMVHPLKPLSNLDANSFQSRISRRFDPLIQSMLKRPLIYVSMFVGALTVAFATKPALQPWPILFLWSAAIVLFLVGTATPGIRMSSRETVARVVEWARVAKWELWAVLALTILAFLCRGLALGTIPHNVHGDEGEMGLVARAVLRGELRDPFATAFLSHPSLWFFIQALALRLFGNTIAGLRMLSAVMGTLAIPALYIFARPLYGRTVAILATSLLSFYHFHIHYSRIGLNNIADPLMMLVTLAAFFYGYLKRSQAGFALTGILMGLAQYFYFGTRSIPVMVFVLIVYLLLKERRQLQTFSGHMAVMGIGFLLAIGPLLRYYMAHPEVYYGRMVERGLLQKGSIYLPDLQANGQSLLTALLGHAYQTFGLFITLNEHSPFYNSGTPLLNHGMDLLFLIGIVLAALSWRKIENFVLLSWVGGAALFGGFLLYDFPQSQRYLIAAPALCILVALAIVQLSILLAQVMGLSPSLQTGFMGMIVAALAFWNLYFYFDIYTPLNSYAENPVTTEVGNYLHSQTGQTFVYMLTPPHFYLNYGNIKFIANDPPGMDIRDPLNSVTALPAPPAGLRPVFIFIPERLNELEVVKQWYPNGNLREYSRPPNAKQIYLYIYEPR